VSTILPGKDVRFTTGPLNAPAAETPPAADVEWPEFVEEPAFQPPVESQPQAIAPDAAISFETGPLLEQVPVSTIRLKPSKGALEDALRESGALVSPSASPSLKEEFETLRRTAEFEDDEQENGVQTQLESADTSLAPIESALNLPRPNPRLEALPATRPNPPFTPHAEVQPAAQDVANYGSEQWPVLLNAPEEESSGRWKLFVAAGLLLATVAVAAAAYFIVIKPKSVDNDKPTTTRFSQPPTTSIPSKAPASNAGVAANPEPASSKPAEGATKQNEEAPKAAQAPATSQQPPAAAQPEVSNGQYSLQAASFPSAGGANEFAEKLKRAGVPAYVVSADLPRKGRWYRVRVGRFNTAEEASRFAGDARLRARTAGVTLQLIPCAFEKP
jgi:cell division septation protein DedD